MTLEEKAIGQLKFMLEQMPEEPPLECDYIDEWLDTDRTIRNAFKTAIKALEQEPKWIPVSEGLPKVPDCYAVTRKIGSDLITSVCFFDRPNTWYNDNQRNLERNCLTNIVAWMPLPEPYKEESESEE